jgi:hypothetical protein
MRKATVFSAGAFAVWSSIRHYSRSSRINHPSERFDRDCYVPVQYQVPIMYSTVRTPFFVSRIFRRCWLTDYKYERSLKASNRSDISVDLSIHTSSRCCSTVQHRQLRIQPENDEIFYAIARPFGILCVGLGSTCRYGSECRRRSTPRHISKPFLCNARWSSKVH